VTIGAVKNDAKGTAQKNRQEYEEITLEKRTLLVKRLTEDDQDTHKVDAGAQKITRKNSLPATEHRPHPGGPQPKKKRLKRLF